MYTAVESTRRWNAVAPWICILLLGLILFAIAATIVISLIALYLPTRNVTGVQSSSGPQTATIQLGSGSNVQTGTLSSTTQTSLQNQMQSALSSNSQIGNSASVQVTNAVGTTGTGKRKRRQGNGTTTATEVIVTYVLFFTGRCPFKSCHDLVTALFRTLLFEITIVLTENQSGSSSGSGSGGSSSGSGSGSGSGGAGGNSNGNGTTTNSSTEPLVADIGIISQYWGNLRPYSDNSPGYFGVTNVGLPSGCQIEQSFILHRHAARYPATTDYTDFGNLVKRLQSANGTYTGPLTFFNTWTYLMGEEVLLPEGTYMELQSGLDFWDRYGRILYHAAAGQNYWNGTGQSQPLLRSDSIQRVIDSCVSWANGFFALYNTTQQYNLLIMTALPGFNATLASYVTCTNFGNSTNGVFNVNEGIYIPVANYLTGTAARLSQYMPSGVNFTAHDAFIFQSLCTYEYVLLGQSDFCNLFTLTEWKGFSYTCDLYIYNGFSFGTPFGRALGLGVLEELIARLKNQTITVSDSSVNTTLDDNTNTFPMGQQFYLDMSHDFMIIGLMTAMSLDYFHTPLAEDDYPPPDNRTFNTANMIPYAARFITEKIGCASSSPTEVSTAYTQYTPTEYGYSPTNASYKFVRMRLNSGILPISTIRGGFCSGRTDGLCPLNNFLASQANASAQANYANICFGNYIYNSSRFNGDGNYFY